MRDGAAVVAFVVLEGAIRQIDSGKNTIVVVTIVVDGAAVVHRFVMAKEAVVSGQSASDVKGCSA